MGRCVLRPPRAHIEAMVTASGRRLCLGHLQVWGKVSPAGSTEMLPGELVAPKRPLRTKGSSCLSTHSVTSKPQETKVENGEPGWGNLGAILAIGFSRLGWAAQFHLPGPCGYSPGHQRSCTQRAGKWTALPKEESIFKWKRGYSLSQLVTHPPTTHPPTNPPSTHQPPIHPPSIHPPSTIRPPSIHPSIPHPPSIHPQTHPFFQHVYETTYTR